jgi:hypothetical protein
VLEFGSLNLFLRLLFFFFKKILFGFHFRRGDHTGLPTLHTGAGHGGDDPGGVGSHDGRRRCELLCHAFRFLVTPDSCRFLAASVW